MLHCLLACIVFKEKPDVIPIFVSLELRCSSHPIGSLQDFVFFFLWLKFKYDIIWCIFLVFFLIGVFWGSLIYGFVTEINFRKFPAVVTSDVFSALFIYASCSNIHLHVYYFFWYLPTFLGYAVIFLDLARGGYFFFFSFSLYISAWKVCIDLYSSLLILSLAVSNLLMSQ